MSLIPLDSSSMIVDVSGQLFFFHDHHWDLGPLGEYRFFASSAMIHLFVITSFIAFVAPFGSYLVGGLKQALKAENFGNSFYSRGVSDCLSVMVILGLFFTIYINSIIYAPRTSFERLVELVLRMSPEAKQTLLQRLQGDTG